MKKISKVWIGAIGIAIVALAAWLLSGKKTMGWLMAPV